LQEDRNTNVTIAARVSGQLIFTLIARYLC